MTDLSPAAQAVMIAARPHLLQSREEVIAAVLRAAADKAENVHPAGPCTEWGEGWLEGVQDVVAGFRRIADELEAHQ